MKFLHQCQRNDGASDLVVRPIAPLDGFNVERLTISTPLSDSKERKGYGSVGPPRYLRRILTAAMQSMTNAPPGRGDRYRSEENAESLRLLRRVVTVITQSRYRSKRKPPIDSIEKISMRTLNPYVYL
jgi:hypothetical protein